MNRIGVLAVSAAAILAAGTMSADAFGGHGGHFGGGHGFGRGIGYGLAGAGLGLGLGYGGYYGYGYDYPAYGYGDPGYGYGTPGYGLSYDQGYAPQYSQAPMLQTGRSAAVGGFGKYCSTPVKSCLLYQPSTMGADCSCKVPGGRSQGNVTP